MNPHNLRYAKPQFTLAEINYLQTAYRETTYEVYHCQETIKLYIGKHNDRLEILLASYSCTSWALIAAFNPYSQPLSEAENNKRHQQLIEYLKPLPFPTLNALGKDESGSWTPEQSLFILGMDRQNAIAVGRQFEQNAIVYGELNQPPQLLWLNK